MPQHDIRHRHELSDGEIVWVQRIGRKWSAVRCSPEIGVPPEIIAEITYSAAVGIVSQWLHDDVCEVY